MPRRTLPSEGRSTVALTTSMAAWSSRSSVMRAISCALKAAQKARDHLGDRPASGFRLRLLELAATAMDGRLHGADGGRERLGDLFERELEHVLEHHGGAFLWSKLRKQRACGLARGLQIRGCDAGLRCSLFGEAAALAADPINPQIRCHPEQPRARIRWRVPHATQRGERLRQSILSQILRVPRATGQVAAVSVELGPQRLVNRQKAVPSPARFAGQRLEWIGG